MRFTKWRFIEKQINPRVYCESSLRVYIIENGTEHHQTDSMNPQDGFGDDCIIFSTILSASSATEGVRTRPDIKNIDDSMHAGFMTFKIIC